MAAQEFGDAARIRTSRPVRNFFASLWLRALTCERFYPSTLEKGYLEYVNVTVSDEPTPRYAKTIFQCRGDPGTLLTAAMVGESALSLLLDKPLPHAVGGGVLTPMFVFGDNLIHRLEANSRFEITSGIVASPGDDIDESRKTR